MVIRANQTSTMAGNSSSVPGIASMLAHPISDKLSKQIHVTWKAQVVATTCGACLEGYLTGKIIKLAAELVAKDDGDKEIKITNLDYEDWLAADQQVLSFLLASVSKDVLIQIAVKKTTTDA
jgi:hypothetical protein